MHSLGHGPKDPPMGGRFLRLLAQDDGDHRLPLCRCRALVDNDLHLPIAFKHCARPLILSDCLNPGQVDLAETALIDTDHLDAMAIALAWEQFELARAG